MAPSTFTWVLGFRDQTQVSGIEVGRLAGQVKVLYCLSHLAEPVNHSLDGSLKSRCLFVLRIWEPGLCHMTRPALTCRRMGDLDQNPAVGHPTAIGVPQVRRSPVEGEGRVLGHRRLWSVVNATYPEPLDFRVACQAVSRAADNWLVSDRDV